MMRFVKMGLIPMIVGVTMLSAENVNSYFNEGFGVDGIPMVNCMQKKKKHKVVIHVDSRDFAVQDLALKNVVNLRKAWGEENAEIEVVVYGPGIGMLLQQSQVYDRVLELGQQEGVTFSACANTINKYNSTHDEEAVLIDGVEIVPSGAARIIELQEQHYGYLRP